MKRAAVTALIFAVLPLLLAHTQWAYMVRLLGVMGLYMIIALGLNIVVGFLGMLDLGFAAFYAIGAYSMALLSMQGMDFWLALPLSMLIAMAVRALLGAPVLRLRGDYLAIVTLGFGEITRLVLNNWDGLTNGPKGLSLLTDSAVRPIRIFGFALFNNVHFYYLIFAAVLIGVTLSYRLQYSRVGRAWMAIREDETAARLTGIQITRMKMIAFVVSAAFAGAAGALFARWENFVTPESFTFWESVSLVAMVVIGGMGSVPGTLFGVAIVVLVPELLRNVLGNEWVSWRYFIFGIALILIVVRRPQGLWPRRERRHDLGVSMILLKTKALGKSFGGLKAVQGLEFSIASGDIVSVIGPNGAGKTTFFNLLTGIYKPDHGSIEFSGERIDGRPPHWIVKRGLARTFQNIRLFNNMTVLENVMVGRHCRTRSELLNAIFRLPGFYREEREIAQSACERLQFVGLLKHGNELASNLPYGAQRRLEIARALATEPRLLLLDEPTAGMNHSESLEMVDLIGRIAAEGVTVILIEHRMSLVMRVSQRVHVLDHGEKIAEGTPAEIQSNARVIEAYLGAGQDTPEISGLGNA